MNVLKCILVQKVGFLKHKSGLLHGHIMKMWWSLKPVHFWDLKQRRLVIRTDVSGTPYLFYLQKSGSPRNNWPLKMGTIHCPEMSVRQYQFAPREIPEEGTSHFHRAGSLKSLLKKYSYSFLIMWITRNVYGHNKNVFDF